MILVLSSRFCGHSQDPHIALLKNSINRLGVPSLFLDPHKILEYNCSLCVVDNKITFLFEDKIICPEIVYLSSPIRPDCIVSFLGVCKYPNLYRRQAEAFWDDFCMAFESAKWFPGLPWDLKRSDSKIMMLLEAGKCGLRIPWTVNASSFPVDLGDVAYKKPITQPFCISHNTETGIEVGLTCYAQKEHRASYISDYGLHQWQRAIDAQAQVRCFMVKEKIWASRWDRSGVEAFVDFRKVNASFRVDWQPTILDHGLVHSLQRLCKKMNICIAAPEFLEDQDGNLWFVDLNPLGDWYGFFDEGIHQEIADAIAEAVTW